MNDSINKMRLLGCRVFVYHNRIVKNRWVTVSPSLKRLQKAVLPKGGKTIVEIQLDDSYFIGEAICSKSDCYNKKRGLAIALGRAINEMSIAFAACWLQEEINLE